jgi:hypothetical protein
MAVGNRWWEGDRGAALLRGARILILSPTLLAAHRLVLVLILVLVLVLLLGRSLQMPLVRFAPLSGSTTQDEYRGKVKFL